MRKRRNPHAGNKGRAPNRHAGTGSASASKTAGVVDLVPIPPASRTPHRRAHRWVSAISHLLLGIAIALGLVTLKVAFEHTPWGSIVEQRTYGVLSGILPQYRPDGPEVVIVDIGDLPGGTQNNATGALVPTPRAELRAILDTLVQLRPRSIGIDIDFSPTPKGWVEDDDPAFFKHCLKLSQATPITLGVYRTLREPRSAWLGLPEFASLAGGMWLPPSGLERTPAWTLAPGIADKLPSLGAKLAAFKGSDVESQIDETGWLRRFRERTDRTGLRPDGLRIGEVLTNHSPVGQLRREAIRIAKAQDLWAHRGAIEGRMVLVGVNKAATDQFPIPMHDMNLPGVVVHASNAYTLAAEPIWEFSPAARYALDFALSGMLIGATLWLTRGAYSASKGDAERSERRALRWISVATLVACALAVYVFRVLWLDFFLVAVSLWLHPKVVALLHRLEQRMKAPASGVVAI